VSLGVKTGDRGSIPGRGERIFPLTSVSRPSLLSTQPPVQWILRVLSQGLKPGRGVRLTTHPHLVPMSRMSATYISSPPKQLHGVSLNSLRFLEVKMKTYSHSNVHQFTVKQKSLMRDAACLEALASFWKTVRQNTLQL
jgi:hypothetical protein